jgi:hypothetical protein
MRSAIFGVVRTGRRKKVVDMPVAGPAGSSITITGWRLDQYDLDIWLEVMHLARDQKPGETVTFTMRGMLKRLHNTVNRGSTDSDWLKQRLDNLAKTTISFEDDRYVGVAGSLVSSFRIDKTTKEAKNAQRSKTVKVPLIMRELLAFRRVRGAFRVLRNCQLCDFPAVTLTERRFVKS